MNTSNSIDCTDLKGNIVSIDASAIKFRVSAYAVIINNDRVVLLSGKTSNKYWFPGGGVEPWEKITEALYREVLEETGLTVVDIEFMKYHDEFFYHNVWNKAFHSVRLFFSCKIGRTQLHSDQSVQDGESIKPRWVPIAKIEEKRLEKSYGMDIIRLANRKSGMD